MKKRHLLTAILTTATILTTQPTPAHADTNTYLNTLTNQGITNNPTDLIAAADDLCNAAIQQNNGGIFIGISPNIAAAIRTQTTLGLTNEQLTVVIRAARNQYCPQNGPV